MLFTKLILNFDRSFSGKGTKQFQWLLAITIAVVSALSLIAQSINLSANSLSCREEDETSTLRLVLTLFIDPGTINEIPLSQRWFALLISIFGLIIFTGVLISVISNILERRIERYRSGDIRYTLSGHIVIIGFNRIAPSIITQICRNPQYDKCYILIQSITPTQIIQDKLHELLNTEEEKRIVIFHARRNSDEELINLNTTRSRELYLLGEEDELGHDFTNIDCLKRIVKIHQQKECRREPLSATVLFENQSTYAIFQLKDISKEWRGYINFRPINYHEEWAKRVIVTRKYTNNDEHIIYPPLDRGGIGINSEKHVHLVIIGMSRMGIALGVEAAHVMHFPNFNKDNKYKTQITFISPDADKEMNYFVGRYNHLFEITPYYYADYTNDKEEEKRQTFEDKRKEKRNSQAQYTTTNFLDLEFNFIKGDVESERIRELLQVWANDEEQILTIAICLSDPPASIAMGLYLPDIIYQKSIPIFIRQKTSGTLLNIVRESNDKVWNKYAHVYPFGMLDNCYEIDRKGEYYALGIKYLYHYQNTYNTLPSTLPTKQVLSELWNKETTALQWSNYYSSYSIGPKLRSLGISEEYPCPELTKEQIDIIAEVEHNRWNVEKLLIGFRKPTEEEEKTKSRSELKNMYVHPDIKPYDDLTEGSQEYDRVITQGIPLILNSYNAN